MSNETVNGSSQPHSGWSGLFKRPRGAGSLLGPDAANLGPDGMLFPPARRSVLLLPHDHPAGNSRIGGHKIDAGAIVAGWSLKPDRAAAGHLNDGAQRGPAE